MPTNRWRLVAKTDELDKAAWLIGAMWNACDAFIGRTTASPGTQESIYLTDAEDAWFRMQLLPGMS